MARRSGVTTPRGFIAGGISCGIKKTGAKDLAIIVSERPATAAGVFTANRVKGAPVLWSRARLRSGTARGVVINSGNSNVLTPAGMEDARRMASAARAAGLKPSETLVASTGVIGQPLPIKKIEKGVEKLAPLLSPAGGAEAAEAILTTDLVSKESSARLMIGSRRVCVGGMAKGSGMVHPAMATMLAFVTTDAAVSSRALREMTREAADASFNRITIDGDMSTSDMLIIMANGASSAPMIEKPAGKRYAALLEAVTAVCVDLAKKIVRDGEGATKFITVRVDGASSEKAARAVAMSIARSSLVKTAMFGEDANWGRILAAAGAAGVPMDVSKVTLAIGGVVIFEKGRLAENPWEARVGRKLKSRDIVVSLRLGAGRARAEVWTCDLSYDYVRINAEYRT
ncbi:MAG: bifunctional glutamate N-acetyltransferase/amino-acid acetyltransferase ArgJ [Candidatus Nitrospinota bacterium M3_3B_026]